MLKQKSLVGTVTYMGRLTSFFCKTFLLKFPESLLYQKDAGDLISFVDYGSEAITNLSNCAGALAKNVLAFYVRGYLETL